MGSIILGVPLSATEMAPKIVPAYNSSASMGVRAPITADESDFEYSGSSKSHGNSSSTSSEYSGSDTETERDGRSGEDELETDTESEEVEEKTPFRSTEGEELVVQETSSRSSSNQRGFSRPSIESGRFKNPIFRPSVRIPDEGSDDNHGLYLSESDELVGVDDYVPKNRKFRPFVPIALISRDSDVDSQGSEVSEDDSFLGSVRVPSMELLQRVNSAPKVRLSEVDLGVGNESLANNNTEMEVVEDDNICVEGSSATVQDEFSDELHTPLSEVEKNELNDEEIQESIDLLKSVVPSSPKEPSEAAESDATELEHDSDFREAALYEDSLESDKSIEKETSEGDNDQTTPTHDLLCSNAAVDKSVHRGVVVDEVLTNFSESQDTLIQIKQEIEETEHIDQFSALLDASPSDNSTNVTVGDVESEEVSFALSSEDNSTDKNKEIDGPIISYLDIVRSLSRTMNGDASGVVAALSEEQREKLVKIQLVRVKYLRLLHRLGFSPKDSIAAHTLLQLTAAEAEVIASQPFDLSYAEEEYAKFALRFDEESIFPLNILVIGKTGVGKSSTVNSIFGEAKASVSAFEPTNADVKEMNGIIRGVKITVLDTPGLRTASSEQSINEKVLKSIKKSAKKQPIDVVLYVDRLDESISLNDLLMFKDISSHLGSSIWRNSIIVLTHANSLPLDGPEGNPLSNDDSVSKRSLTIQRIIALSCGEMNHSSKAAVSLVGNSRYPENQVERWRLELMLICCSTKTLSEAKSIVSDNQIPFFLSSLLQSNDDPTNENICDSHLKPQTQSRTDKREQPFFSSINREDDHDHSYHDRVLVEYELRIVDSVLKARKVFRSFDGNTTDAGILSFTYPIDDENQTSLGLSFMGHGAEVEPWFSLISGRNSKLKIWAGLKNGERSRRICVRMGGSDQLQLAAMALLSVASAIFKKIFLPSKMNKSLV